MLFKIHKIDGSGPVFYEKCTYEIFAKKK